MEEEEEEPQEEETENELAQISVHALAGISDYQTMRITGHHQKRSLQILLDTGSTHNFMDTSTAHQLGCVLCKKGNVMVRVADGRRVLYDSMVEKFTWKMKGMEFTTELFVMPLKGCDIVLGVQWFSTLGSVTFDFTQHSIEFQMQGRKIMLRRAADKGIKTVNPQRMNKAMSQEGHTSLI